MGCNYSTETVTQNHPRDLKFDKKSNRLSKHLDIYDKENKENKINKENDLDNALAGFENNIDSALQDIVLHSTASADLGFGSNTSENDDMRTNTGAEIGIESIDTTTLIEETDINEPTTNTTTTTDDKHQESSTNANVKECNDTDNDNNESKEDGVGNQNRDNGDNRGDEEHEDRDIESNHDPNQFMNDMSDYEEESDTECRQTMEGNMKKKSPSMIAGWQMRYCVLHENSIFSYYGSVSEYIVNM